MWYIAVDQTMSDGWDLNSFLSCEPYKLTLSQRSLKNDSSPGSVVMHGSPWEMHILDIISRESTAPAGAIPAPKPSILISYAGKNRTSPSWGLVGGARGALRGHCGTQTCPHLVLNFLSRKYTVFSLMSSCSDIQPCHGPGGLKLKLPLLYELTISFLWWQDWHKWVDKFLKLKK